MSEASAELATRVRLSDPKPAYCAACWCAAQETVRFVDFDAAVDRGTRTNSEGWVLDGIDDLHLCEDCVRAGAQALELKPDLHTRQNREIARLERERDHWKDYAKRIEATMQDRPIELEKSRRKVGT